MSRKATFFRIAGIDSVAIWIFPEKSHADKSNAKWETFVRFYQVFQFFQIFIIYAQRELHIWTPPLNSALKITLVWKFWAAEVVEAKECPAILVWSNAKTPDFVWKHIYSDIVEIYRSITCYSNFWWFHKI